MKATKTGYALITSAIAILTIVVGAFSVAKMRPMITGLGIVYSSSKQMQKHFRTHILTFDIGFCQKDWI